MKCTDEILKILNSGGKYVLDRFNSILEVVCVELHIYDREAKKSTYRDKNFKIAHWTYTKQENRMRIRQRSENKRNNSGKRALRERGCGYSGNPRWSLWSL